MNDTNHTPVDDPLYQKLIPMLPGLGKFRVGAVQRRLLIGYNRASRLMDQLANDGRIREVPDERGGYYIATTPKDQTP